MNRLEPIYHIAQYINILLYIYTDDLADLPIRNLCHFTERFEDIYDIPRYPYQPICNLYGFRNGGYI